VIPVSTPTLSDGLVECLAAFSLDSATPGVADRARLVLLDTLGAAASVAGLPHPTLRALATFVRESGGGCEATLIGQGRRTSCVTAAFFNAALATFGLTDPLHVETTVHAPAVVAAATLALGEHARASGRRLLEAFVLGTEVTCRVSAALDPKALYGRGFHPTGVCGTFGAAVGAAHVLGLTAGGIRAALGFALQHAAGSLAWVTDPTEGARPLSPALAAQHGAQAARLAALGLSGPPAPLDGAENAFVAFSGSGAPRALLEGWGRRFYLLEMTHKMHASCTYSHAALDAVLAIAREYTLRPEDVVAVTLRCTPSAYRFLADPTLHSCFGPHLVAVALVRGHVAIGDVAAPGLEHPEYDRLVQSTRVVADPALAGVESDRCPATVELRTVTGAVLTARSDAAKGSSDHPLSPGEIRAKFRAAAAPILSPARAARLAGVVDRIETVSHVETLAGLLRARPAAGRRPSSVAIRSSPSKEARPWRTPR
jgi:2-methylcitrate dehydratase PrpD